MTIKIHLVSDLHNQRLKLSSEKVNLETDIFVNAGDSGFWTPGYLLSKINRVYARGNHDFWAMHLENIKKIKPQVQRIKGYTFLSCTLWSNLWNLPFVSMGLKMIDEIEKNLNDFCKIKDFTCKEMVSLFNEDFSFLLAEVKARKNEKIIIVTHFPPSKKSISPRFKNDFLNPYFVNNLDEFILDNPNIKLWFHGHVHSSCDYKIGETRVVCNPQGYKLKNGKFENSDFNENLIIEIE